jgi:hypothetical protein
MVVRVRLPEVALRHYLRPRPDRTIPGRVLTAPIRREELVPAEFVLASSRDAGLVELPVQADPGDMAQGLRAGDTVQVVAAFTEGARRGGRSSCSRRPRSSGCSRTPRGSPAPARNGASSYACPATGPRSSPRPGSSWSRHRARPPDRRPPGRSRQASPSSPDPRPAQRRRRLCRPRRSRLPRSPSRPIPPSPPVTWLGPRPEGWRDEAAARGRRGGGGLGVGPGAGVLTLGVPRLATLPGVSG